MVEVQLQLEDYQVLLSMLRPPTSRCVVHRCLLPILALRPLIFNMQLPLHLLNRFLVTARNLSQPLHGLTLSRLPLRSPVMMQNKRKRNWNVINVIILLGSCMNLFGQLSLVLRAPFQLLGQETLEVVVLGKASETQSTLLSTTSAHSCLGGHPLRFEVRRRLMKDIRQAPTLDMLPLKAGIE